MSNKKTQRKRERAAARRVAAENRASSKKHYRIRKAEERARRDALVAKAFDKFESPKDQFVRVDLDFRIKQIIRRRGRKLTEPRYHEALRLLARYPWVRDIEEWKPRGKSGTSLFKSLARHLLVKYTMPEFLFSVFFASEDDATARHGRALFVELGQGIGLYSRVKEGRFPVPLTKRMCHVFMQSTAKLGFLEAVRHAQVLVFGGDRRLAETVASTRQLGQAFRPHEDFWSTVVQWVCAQSMLAPSQIGPIFDWIAAQHGGNTSFSMKGRTGVSVLRAVEEWHGDLARAKVISGHVYVPSGYVPWFGERKVTLPTGAHYLEKHCVVEIANSKELAAEGRKMRHCVYSYSWSIQKGTVSIWSYRVDGERTLTLEVDNASRRLVQCRGHSNRTASPSEMAQIERWMKVNGLVKASWLR